MKIAVIGNTAASHQVAQHLLTCENVEKVYHLGAPDLQKSTSRYIKLLSQFKRTDSGEAVNHIIPTIKELDVDLIVPMTNSFQLWTAFHNAVNGTPTLLPSKEIGLLEWSKIEGKKLLTSLNIPTASYKVFSLQELRSKFLKLERPFVLKYDQDWRAGLQTVIITNDNVEAEYATLISEQTTKRFLDAFGDFVDQKFIVEDFIPGTSELSYHALSNNVSWTYLGSARDYKTFKENDIGHNTAGMGAYRIVEDVDAKIHEYANRIFEHFKEQGTPYVGFLYLGIMFDTNNNPVVLEINTRPGDPEITTIIPGIKTNLASLLYRAAKHEQLSPLEFSNLHSVSIRIVNKKYNLDKPEKYVEPVIPETNEFCIGYNEHRELLHSVITSTDSNTKDAAGKLYKFLATTTLGDFTFRKDIGHLA